MTIKQLYNHPTRRWLELFCVIFGHEWNAYGSETEGDRIVQEYNVCSRCHLSRRLVWIEQPSEAGRTWKAMAT